MADKAIHEMISAYAAGCMDDENFTQFKDYWHKGGELPEKELGELQNVISLVPVILEIEKPPSVLKDKVAQRLISIQSEIKEKIKKEQEIKRTRELELLNKTQEDSNSSRDSIRPMFDKKKEEPEEIKRNFSTYEEYRIETGDLPDKKAEEEAKPNEKHVEERAEKSTHWIFWLVIVILVILFGTVSYLFMQSNKELHTTVENLNKQTNKLKSQLNSTDQFVTAYMSLIEFINYKDVIVINLSGSDFNPSSSGKLFLSFDAREGLLSLNNMPALRADEVYQLWIISRGRSYSLGTFVSVPGRKFIKVSNIPYVPETEIDLIRVTNEETSGADIPKGNTFLFGALPGKADRRTR
ncbi:MAG: anti-sigma factor [Ignavibacteria bacterium]|jgi:hypothetical protein